MISHNWQLWNELEFHVSEETDQEDSVASVDCALSPRVVSFQVIDSRYIAFIFKSGTGLD